MSTDRGTDLLLRAAKTMQEQHGPEHVRHEFWGHLADWLHHVAYALAIGDPEKLLGFGEPTDARRVAAAYLQSTEDGQA
jgi:hypothetical protein